MIKTVLKCFVVIITVMVLLFSGITGIGFKVERVYAATPQSENFELREVGTAPIPRIMGDWRYSILDFSENESMNIDTTTAPFIDVANNKGGGYALAGGANKALFVQGRYGTDVALKIRSASGNAFKLEGFRAENDTSITDNYSVKGYKDGNPVAGAIHNFTAPQSLVTHVNLGESFNNIDEFRIVLQDGSADITIFLDDIMVSDPIIPIHANHTAISGVATITPVAGVNNPITLTVLDSLGNTDTAFNGDKNVTITGIHAAQNGSYGSFNGTELNINSAVAGQVILVTFTNGVATPDLVLNKSGAQTIGFSIAGVNTPSTNSLTITPSHGTAENMTLTQNITSPAENGGQFAQQPIITIRDAYNNTCTSDSTTVITATKQDAGTWTLTGTTTATASNGITTFTNIGATNSAQVNDAQLAFNTGGLVEITSATVTLPASTAKGITSFNFGGLTPTVPGTINEGAKTIALTVPYGTNITALVPTISHTGVTIAPSTGTAQDFTNPVTYTVTAGDTSTQEYVVTVTIAPQTPSGGGGSSTPALTTPIPVAGTDTIIIVNGEEQRAGTVTTQQVNGKTFINVAIISEVITNKIEEIIKKQIETGKKEENTIVVPIMSKGADKLTTILTGEIVKQMEANEFKLAVKSDDITYTIPAKEVGVDRIAEILGVASADLKEISIDIKIDKVDQTVVESILAKAKAQAYEIIFPPVEFSITARTITNSGEEKEVNISSFNQYIERVIEIPEGVDPSKITTGIVYNLDGSFSHVPTQIFKKDGKYFARINSFTNSIYTVIWNPISVPAVEKHWSKEYVNDMASRLIIKDPDIFKPDGVITRGEFAEYITKALGLYRTGVATAGKFIDVNPSNKLADAITIATDYKIITGYPDGTFKPDVKISREEAMIMYAIAIDIVGLSEIDNNIIENYIDTEQISNWAYPLIKKTISVGVFNGRTHETIDPKGTFTYAEAATAIRNLLRASGLITNSIT